MEYLMMLSFTAPLLARLGMKLLKIEVPEDVYGFEDVDYV